MEAIITKTLIAIPCMDTLHTAFADALLRMDKPPGTSVCFKPNSLIYDSRNLLSLTAIENNFDNVLWLDSDIIMPADTLVRMQQYATNGYNMVSGLYFKRTMPTAPVIFSRIDPPAPDENGHVTKHIDEYTNYPSNKLIPVAGCGFGCVMTTTTLLRKLWDEFFPPFAPYPWAGEDISFCHRVNLSGFKIYCDTSIRCSHIGTFAYTDQLYQQQGGDWNGQK